MSNPNQPDLEALNAYIAEVRDTPFQWHNFDCFMFTNTAFQRMYGAGWVDGPGRQVYRTQWPVYEAS